MPLSRLTLLQLRAVVAIHGGRIDVLYGGSTFLLRGRGCMMSLAACHQGTVDRVLVSMWSAQICLWDRHATGMLGEQNSTQEP